MEKITLGETNIETIGLLFEPNFFRIHCYSDLEGADFVKTFTCNRNAQYDFSELKAKNHLFATLAHPHWTLVPSAIFREEDAASYLKLNTGYDEKNSHSYSILDGLDCVLIYEQDEEAEKVVAQIQPALQTKHLSNTLLEYGRRIVSETKGDFLNVQVLDQSAFISIFKKGSLLLANSIDAEKAEDLVYYIFYALKKLELSTDISAEFGGTGKILPSVKKQASKFLPNLEDAGQKSDNGQLEKIIPLCA